MKNNNKQSNNSLFALERGLLANKTAEQESHQPSPKQQKQKQKRSRKEARALDFGEVIQLQYNGDAFPSATPAVGSFSNSKSSELEDESSSFEVEAGAFDFGEAIQLQYDTDVLPTANPEAMSFYDSKSFASELEDESLPFEVEAFEVDEEVTPVKKTVTPQPEVQVKPAIKPEVTPKPPIEVESFNETEEVTSKPMQVQSVQVNEGVTSNSAEVQPVKATVVSPSGMPSKSSSSKQLTTFVPTPPQEELSDAEAFAADLQAILNGEKTYDLEQKQVVPTSQSSPPAAEPAEPAEAAPHPHDIFDKGTDIPPQKQVDPEPVPMSRSHAVFDEMGNNMVHATDFDHGTVDLALEQRFDEFDRILDEEDNKQSTSLVVSANTQLASSKNQELFPIDENH